MVADVLSGGMQKSMSGGEGTDFTIGSLQDGQAYVAYVAAQDCVPNDTPLTSETFNTPDITPPTVASSAVSDVTETTATLTITTNEASTCHYHAAKATDPAQKKKN